MIPEKTRKKATSLAHVPALFDTVIEAFSDRNRRLRYEENIVQDNVFENVVVEFQRKLIFELNCFERDSMRSLKKS